jgi:hypothetical protein
MADDIDAEVESLFANSPKKKDPYEEKQEPYKGFDIGGNKVADDTERFERTRAAGSDNVFSGLGDDYSEVNVKKKEAQEEKKYRKTQYEGIPTLGTSIDKDEEHTKAHEVARIEREKEWKIAKKLPWESTSEADKRREEEGYDTKVTKYPGEGAIDATFRNIKGAVKSIPTNPIDVITGVKGYASEAKLKLEASKYGITPEHYERLKGTTEGVDFIRETIGRGKSAEAGLKHAVSIDEKTKAEAAALRAQASQRYAKAEQISQVPAGRKAIQFGSNAFGQSPIYITGGSHGAVRQKFIPGQNSGVSTSLAASRLEIARMKERVLSGASGSGINAVRAMQPHANIGGLPSAVSRLAASSPRANPVSKLSPTGQYRMGPSILDKLSSFRKRP